MKRLLSLLIILIVICNKMYGEEKEIILTTKTGNIYGTILIPENKQTKDVIALIICGSGPTDRNGNNQQMQNNSIKYLAEDLYNAGIPSVRYDKRAIAKSASSAVSEENLRFTTYADDAREWINMLWKDYKKVIVIGHSEGAMLGILASINNPKISALVLIAGLGRPADEVLKQQLSEQPILAAITDVAFSIIDSLKKGETVNNVPPILNSLFRTSVQPYMISWFAVNPAMEIAKIKNPTLIIQGDKDIQVSVKDAELLHQSAPNSKKIIISNMNHVFKECNTTDIITHISLYNNPNIKNIPQLSSNIINFINESTLKSKN